MAATMKRSYDDVITDDLRNVLRSVLEDSGNTDAEDEDNGIVKPYLAETESSPYSAVYTSEYKILSKSIDEVVRLLLHPTSETSYRNAIINELIEEVAIRTKAQFPTQVCVALVGDMKAGKSSVINSILSVGMIARQDDNGRSCTWVTQEFCHTLPGQTHAFGAEIHFFGQEERHAIIRSLLADYFRASPNSNDDLEDRKETQEQVADFGVMRSTTEAFCALFNNKREFRNEETARTYLANATSEDDESLLQTLFAWADDLMDKTLQGVDHVFVEASTTQTLLFEVQQYVTTVGERDGSMVVSLWPFVSHLKFGLENRLLEKGISLLDLPGLSDANKTRVRNAHLHLRRCTHQVVVAEIGRAHDADFIRTQLTEGFQSRGSGRTMLVLTHADTIDDTSEVMGTTSEKRQLEVLRAKLCNTEEERSFVHKKIKSSTGDTKLALLEARDKFDEKVTNLKLEEQELRIATRSRRVSAQLKAFYGELTSDPVTLPVFCVGNRAYQKHQAGYSTADPNPPSLSVQGTNVPKLREHLCLAPAEGKLNETRRLVDNQLPTLLSCFKLYVSSTQLEAKDEIQDIIVAPQSIIAALVGQIFQDFSHEVDTKILQPYMKEEWDFTTHAGELCVKWARKYSTREHFAMLKNHGLRNARGKTTVAVSWNKELLDHNVEVIVQCFADLRPMLEAWPIGTTKALRALVQEVELKIKANPRVGIMALKPFLTYLHQEKANIKDLVDAVLRSFRKGLIDCKKSATTDQPDNHLYLAMEKVYEKTKTIKGGRGAVQRRLAAFASETSSTSGVWVEAHDRLRDQFKKVLEDHCNQLTKVMTEYFGGIQKHFNTMCANEEETKEEMQLKQKLAENLTMAEEQMDKVKQNWEAVLAADKDTMFVN